MPPKTTVSPRKTRSGSTAKVNAKRPAPAEDDAKVSKGKKAKGDASLPDMTLMNQSNEPVSISSLTKDSGLVLFLYPKANTPGCTKQACGFRDAYDSFVKKGYQVYGLSGDSPKSLENWKNKYSLPFDLLSDPLHALIKPLGSHKAPKSVARSVFVFSQGGQLQLARVEFTIYYMRLYSTLRRSLHPEQYLQIAREWPKELHYPGNFARHTPDEDYEYLPNGGHSTENPTGEDTHAYKTTLSTPLTTALLGLGVLGWMGSRLNDYYTRDMPVHPLTAWIASYSTVDTPYKDDERMIPLLQTLADDRLILNEKRFEPFRHRIAFVGSLERASDRHVTPGTHVDVDNLQIQHSWQKDDDLLKS